MRELKRETIVIPKQILDSKQIAVAVYYDGSLIGSNITAKYNRYSGCALWASLRALLVTSPFID